MDILNHTNSHNKINNPTTSQPQTPILLSQGTYGCVYYPGFTCKGKIQKTKYVTKLQKNNETLQNEMEIGKKIQKIKNYKNYFAPILKQCPVYLTTLQKKYSQPLNQCKIIKESPLPPPPPSNNNNKFIQNQKKNQQEMNINKIRYILGDDLEETFQKKNVVLQSSFGFLIDTYQYLSKSLNKLKTQKIVHYDLKANNIIYDKESEIPIIIDFGLSINLDNINPTAPEPKLLTHYFFDTYEYDYWCLQPILIGIYAYFYYDDKSSSLYQQTLSPLLIKKYKETIKQYIEFAFFFKPEFLTKLSQLFPPQQAIQTTIQTFTKTFHDHWQKKVEEHSNDTILVFFQFLWNSKFEWDKYALSVIYLDFLSQLTPLPHDDPQLPKLEEFTQSLLNQILSLP
jgi:serine/threonine protein kinase